jgi:hypothetical protein
MLGTMNLALMVSGRGDRADRVFRCSSALHVLVKPANRICLKETAPAHARRTLGPSLGTIRVYRITLTSDEHIWFPTAVLSCSHGPFLCAECVFEQLP